MTKTNPNEMKSVEAVNKAAQVSKEQSSAEEQKENIPQSNNTAEENKPVSQQGQSTSSDSLSEKTELSATEILTADELKIIKWLEESTPKPRQLKGALNILDTGIELREEILSKQSDQAKRIPGIDRRIETLDFFDSEVGVGDRYLSELNKIKLQTELTNLREKRYLVWQKFVKVCGSEKKALQYIGLRAKAKSSYYHSKSSYFVKQRILKILNTIIKSDQKPDLVKVKQLADHSSGNGLKQFNAGMRDLLDVFDEDLVILCSHKHREEYFNLMRLTMLKWDPDSDTEINELVIANESE